MRGGKLLIISSPSLLPTFQAWNGRLPLPTHEKYPHSVYMTDEATKTYKNKPYKKSFACPLL